MRFWRSFTLTFLATLLIGLVFVGGYVLGGRSSASAAATNGGTFGLLWDVQNLLRDEFLGDAPAEQAQVYGAIRGMVQAYNDPYTVFVEPAPRVLERDDLRGHFGGIGATMGRDEANNLILHPMRDRPAARAGVEEGDILLAVDGKPVTPEMSVDDVVVLVRGEEGTQVRLTIRKPGSSAAVDIAITRERIEVPSVEWRIIDHAQRIGYVYVSIIGERTSEELKTGLADLSAQGADKLILDLRGDGGGYLDSAVDATSQFLKDGVVLREIKRGGEERFYPVKPVEGPAKEWPMVVLVDGGTASAAEIIAGALRDHGRAVLIGEKTYGKGSVQRVHELRDGSSLHVTVARWLTPNRIQLDKAGLEPEVHISLSPEDRDAGRDPQLDRAVAWLRGER